MNAQRKVVYTRRRHAVMGERIGVDFMNMAYDVAGSLVQQLQDTADFEAFRLGVFSNFGIEVPFDETNYKQLKHDDMVEQIYSTAMDGYNRRSEQLAETVAPQIKELAERLKDNPQIRYIRVPFTDGKHVYNIPCDIQEAAATDGKSVAKNFLKAILLNTIDQAWMNNLRDLDDLKQNTQNAHYEQKDPLLIYKIEAFHIFEEMVQKMNSRAVSILMRSRLHVPENQEMQQDSAPERRRDYSRMQASHAQAGSSTQPGQLAAARPGQPPVPQPRAPFVGGPHVGRNDPCPCGSGKKYKNCHGKGL